jgi:hypothetical protein
MDFGPDYRKAAIKRADEELLAALGYKQEFKREFTPLQVFGLAFRFDLISLYGYDHLKIMAPLSVS